MKTLHFAPLAALCFAAPASAQTCVNYWDFATSTDVVGGVTSINVGTPDLSVDATYGEAYTGSGNSLNTTFNVQSYLIADTHNGVSPNALDFGTNDFSFSYWSYNDATDGNTRGVRIFDFLDGTGEGVQIATNATGIYNLRVDTSDGGASISNNTLGALMQPDNQWVHIVVNVDRANDQYEIYYGGVSQGVVPMSAPNNGTIRATRDMDIGLINSDGTNNQAESGALDDLAFYDAQLSATDIAGLAAGTLTPLNFAGGPTGPEFCNGNGGTMPGCTDCPCGNNAAAGTVGGCLNSNGTSARLNVSGVAMVGADTLRFEVTGANPITFGILQSANNQLPNMGSCPAGSGIVSPVLDGLRCVGGGALRHGTRASDANGDIGVANNGWGFGSGPVGGLIAANGFTAGQTRHFQCFYREDTATGCLTGQNTTQGVSVTFL